MERYEDNIILKTNQNKQYFKGKFYPNIPLSESDNYIITTIGDRLDTLAYQYYNDSTLWWVIAMANNNVTKGFLYPEPGTQLRIPININSVITEFNNFNNAR
jgi:nucleoid-associated protein YgaU